MQRAISCRFVMTAQTRRSLKGYWKSGLVLHSSMLPKMLGFITNICDNSKWPSSFSTFGKPFSNCVRLRCTADEDEGRWSLLYAVRHSIWLLSALEPETFSAILFDNLFCGGITLAECLPPYKEGRIRLVSMEDWGWISFVLAKKTSVDFCPVCLFRKYSEFRRKLLSFSWSFWILDFDLYSAYFRRKWLDV